ncbi:MAG TPA: hypothetical protein P5514_05740 [Bacteroidales bacterium]|nr:hypothetical protein [Bacteroidales bacterium]HRX96428.1 hypothetical protein [Bacteroidales bacterium]
MKTNIILAFIIVIALGLPGLSQNDVPKLLDEASSSYSSGDLENARFALQEALNGINQAIGQDILSQLPQTIGDMSIVENSDNVTGTNLGFAGLYVNRDYKSETSELNFQIISDSPMMAAISSMLSMSVFMAADPNQKRIKLDGYKALMTRNEDSEGVVSYDIQLPFGSSLMTFTVNGISDGDEVEQLLGEIPVGTIIEKAQ